MALQQIPGGGCWIPNELVHITSALVFGSSSAIAASADQAILIGRVWFKERTGSKSLQTVGFRFGTVTKAGLSGLTVTVQGVHATLGPPFQPDGVAGQTVAIANGNAAFLSNTWINTGNLSATRTVNFGDLIAVIVGYDGGGRLGTDSFTLTGMNAAAAGFTRLQSAALENLLTGAYSITASTVPVIVLGFNDGTFGTLAGSFPASAIGSHAFNSGSSPNEYALGIQFPFPCKCSGVFINVQAVAVGADFNVVLYGGATPTTVIQSVPVTSKQIGTTGASRLLYVPFTEAALTLNAKYYLSVQPTTVNSVTIPYYDVSNASHFQACGGGANFSEYTRAGGAWTQVTTRRPVMIAEISSFDDATGGGGATAANPVAGFLA